jgi:sugar lactone lactonase YvrE
MRKTILAAVLAAALASLAVGAAPALATTAAATADATARGLRPPAVINGTAPSLHPEGVAWDPTRRAFLVSSVRHGTVSVVSPSGTVRTLVQDDRMVSTFGVHVDAARGRLLVTYADLGLGDRANGRSGLGIFDLGTGRPLHLVDLGHLANDLTIAPDGTAYVTDPGGDALYTVDTAGRASVLVQSPRFAGTGFTLNGIVWHPGGYLLVVRYDVGILFRIPLCDPVHFTEVALDRPLVGGDGMALRPDGSLVVSTNTLGSTGEDAVQVLRSGDGWASAHQVSRTAPWPDRAPTTVAVSPYGTYVLSGRLDVLLGGGTTDAFTLRRL